MHYVYSFCRQSRTFMLLVISYCFVALFLRLCVHETKIRFTLGKGRDIVTLWKTSQCIMHFCWYTQYCSELFITFKFWFFRSIYIYSHTVWDVGLHYTPGECLNSEHSLVLLLYGWEYIVASSFVSNRYKFNTNIEDNNFKVDIFLGYSTASIPFLVRKLLICFQSELETIENGTYCTYSWVCRQAEAINKINILKRHFVATLI